MIIQNVPCSNCFLFSFDHSIRRKCLFAPTSYSPFTHDAICRHLVKKYRVSRSSTCRFEYFLPTLLGPTYRVSLIHPGHSKLPAVVLLAELTK